MIHTLNPKTDLNDEKTGVYKIKCEDCDAHYIGQTGRKFKKTVRRTIQGITNPNYSSFQDLEVLHLAERCRTLDVLEKYKIYDAVKKKPTQGSDKQTTSKNNPIFYILRKNS